jgi:hypothetical protein
MPITNYLPSSRLIQPGVCTSTTRPASPFEGQAIFETDTDRVLYWNGSAWYPAWNTAWGQVAYNQRTSNITGVGTTTTEVTSVTFTAVAGRRYSIAGYFGVLKEGSSNYAQAFVFKDSTQIARLSHMLVPAGNEHGLNGVCFDSPSGGSVTYRLMVSFGANTLNQVVGNSTAPAYIQVSDIGPA